MKDAEWVELTGAVYVPPGVWVRIGDIEVLNVGTEKDPAVKAVVAHRMDDGTIDLPAGVGCAWSVRPYGG